MIVTSKLQSVIYEIPDEEDKQSSIHNTKKRRVIRTLSSQVNSIRQSKNTLSTIHKEDNGNGNDDGDNDKTITIDNHSNLINNNNDSSDKGSYRRMSCQEISHSNNKHIQYNKGHMKHMRCIGDEREFFDISLDSNSNSNSVNKHKKINSDANSNSELKEDEIKLEIEDYIEKGLNNNNKVIKSFDATRLITFKEVWIYFSLMKIDKEKMNVEVEDLRRLNCLQHLLSKCFKQYELSSYLKPERERIFLLTKLPHDNSNIIHKRTLESIYQYLIQTNDPLYYNWESIGFQGDPKQDLRSVGIFGLIQYISFIDRYPSLSLGFFNFLKSIQSEWIFSILLLNITKMTLELLKTGTLISFCNKRRKVLETLNDFYYGVIFHISKEFVSQNKHLLLDKSNITIEYISHLIREIKAFAEKNPAHFFWNTKQLNEMYPEVVISISRTCSIESNDSNNNKKELGHGLN